MDLKHAITTTIAIIALVVSITVAYTNIRRLEELRVVSVQRLTPAFEDTKIGQVILPYAVQLAFINNGNTSIAVTGASAALGHSEDQDVSPPNDCGSDALFGTDLEPFVLKQSDVSIRKITLIPDDNYKNITHKTDKSLTVDIPDTIKKSNQAIFCIRVDLATPSDPLAYGQMVLGRYQFTPPNGVGIRVDYPPVPNVVWHANHFLFD